MTTTLIRNVAVEVDGDGQAVVCIHGLGGSSNNWTPVLSAFEGMKVVRPELPGSARSALSSEPLSIDLYVQTLADVLGELGVTKAHVVAHSMGTIVAQHLAIKHPDLVKSLALFGPLLAPPEQGRAGIHARAALSREKGIAGVQEIADAIVKGATSAETKAQRPVTLAIVRESVMRQSPEGYAQSCEALAGAQAAEIEKIAVPTLLVTGDEDGVGQHRRKQGKSSARLRSLDDI
jgi:3-oxoadipate enol-lactonase